VIERIKVKAKWRIDRFEDPTGEIAKFLKAGGSVEEAIKKFGRNYQGRREFKGNVFLNEGIGEIWDLVTGVSANHFDSASAQIGVGDGTTAEDPTQTDLVGASTAYVGMDAGYPSRAAQTLTFRGTFDGATANFTWNECSVKHATTGINLNRKVQSMGTKASGTTWVLTLDLTIS